MSASDEGLEPDAAPAQPVPKAVRVVVWIAAPLLLLVIIGLSAYAIISWRVYSERDAALERVRAAGDPVRSEDIVQPSGSGKAPGEWLARVTKLKDVVGLGTLTQEDEAEYYTDLFEETEMRAYDPAVAQALRNLDTCLFPGGRTGIDKEVLEAQVKAVIREAFGAPTREPDSPCAALLREFVLMTGDEACRLGEEAVGLAPIGIDELRQSMRDKDSPLPQLPIRELGVIIQELRLRALLRAHRADAAGALSDIERMLDQCAMNQLPADMNQGLIWLFQVGMTMEALPRVLVMLEPGANVGGLDSWLAGIHVRAGLAQGERGSRALTVSVFDKLIDTAGGGSGRLPALLIVNSERRLIEDYELQLPSFDLAYWERPPLPALPEYSRWDGLAAFFTSKVQGLLDNADRQELSIEFARIAIENYRAGLDAALQRADATIDPFSGRPLLCRRTEHGAEVWSVGPSTAVEPEERIGLKIELRER